MGNAAATPQFPPCTEAEIDKYGNELKQKIEAQTAKITNFPGFSVTIHLDSQKVSLEIDEKAWVKFEKEINNEYFLVRRSVLPLDFDGNSCISYQLIRNKCSPTSQSDSQSSARPEQSVSVTTIS